MNDNKKHKIVIIGYPTVLLPYAFLYLYNQMFVQKSVH